MKNLRIFSAAALSCYPTFAQADSTLTPPPQWEATATMGIGFNAARLPKGSAQDLVDEGEHEVSIEIVKSDFLFKTWPLRFKGGATYSPQAFDDQDPSSATYAEIGLGNTAKNLDDLLQRNTLLKRHVKKYEGKIKPYFLFRHTDGQSGFIDGHKRYDDNLSGGFSYTTNNPWHCSAIEDGVCKSNWKLIIGADIARNWSSDGTQRYWQTKASVKGITPSLDLTAKFNLFAKFDVSRRSFDSVPQLVKDRKDWSYKTSGGVEVTFDIHGIDFAGNAGLRYQVRNSNVDANDYHRTYGFGSLEASVKF
ncbi:hypothetical protein LWE61_03935 [Sphingobium sufflavum]|uniref:hypothetical protein n=1 Tax=Sphingobium sufflavum TaxID=1129547 RepID=UPI001F223255|nr:hypothetical protein [Sphingobium sufflavum]MCE7795705.1 hypothetical protein [Sphingobium sufflavum]